MAKTRKPASGSKPAVKKSSATSSSTIGKPKVWEKPTEELIEKFYAALPDDPRVERKKMFGYPAAFVNGNLTVSMHNQNIIARMGEKERSEWINKKGAKLFEPMPGRAMKEYIVIPQAIVNDDKALKAAVQQSVDFVLGLKPKEKKKK